MANTLFLRLEGPLQSWGERARWTVRDTAPEPTKSGLVGLLGCALGLSADEDLRRLSVALRLGVRCDRPGSVLKDYHTVVGGVLAADGKIKRTQSTGRPETVVSNRYYLCDASFLAALRGEPDLIARLAEAVQNPRWPLFLGRLCCAPARPLYEGQGDFATLEQALATWPGLPPRPGEKLGRVRAVVECPPGQGTGRLDEVGSAVHRTFLPRFVRELSVEVAPPAKEVTP